MSMSVTSSGLITAEGDRKVGKNEGWVVSGDLFFFKWAGAKKGRERTSILT